ncbi:hypothetical protein EBR96_00605 [bacterium]|nr:hypothetical protein [bacterium]
MKLSTLSNYLNPLFNYSSRQGLRAICVFLVLWGISGHVFGKDPQVISKLELKRYTGLWYQIAHLPNFFQKSCVKGSTAEYRLLESGYIEVCNKCKKADGSTQSVTGLARVENPPQNSKLSVSFVEVLGFRPIWGDYWVLGIGPNYEYSVVGDRSRKFAWILGRTPKLDKEMLEDALSVLKENGFDTSKLTYEAVD